MLTPELYRSHFSVLSARFVFSVEVRVRQFYNVRVPSCDSPRHRSAADRQPARHDHHSRDAIAGPRVLAGRRHLLRAQHRGARAGGRAVARRAGARARSCRSGSASIRKAAGSRASRRRSPSGRRWRCSGAAATCQLAGTVCDGAGHRAAGRSASRSTTRRSSTSTPIRRTRSSAIARWPRTRTAWRGSARPSSRACRTTASRPAASTFPGHGDTSVDSHLELPLVEHPPDRIRRVECVPFRDGDSRPAWPSS